MPNQLNEPSHTAAPPSRPVLASISTGGKSEAPHEDRRSEARYPAKEPAELEILFGGAEPVFGIILDISRSGLRIAIPRRIARGEQVKVKFQNNVIFGEIRYCRAVSAVFHAGIRIQDLVRCPGREDQHLTEDSLALYAVGRGLSVSEVIELREHLLRCERCRARVAERQTALNPRRHSRRRSES